MQRANTLWPSLLPVRGVRQATHAPPPPPPPQPVPREPTPWEGTPPVPTVTQAMPVRPRLH